MENRRKLLIASLLIVGVLVMVYAVAENVEVGVPCGLATALLGCVFWLLAE
jgi:hypothetical protein